MTGTNYRKLVGQLQAIAPMCNFEIPEILCNKMELFFRRRHAWANREITSLINLRMGQFRSKKARA